MSKGFRKIVKAELSLHTGLYCFLPQISRTQSLPFASTWQRFQFSFTLGSFFWAYFLVLRFSRRDIAPRKNLGTTAVANTVGASVYQNTKERLKKENWYVSCCHGDQWYVSRSTHRQSIVRLLGDSSKHHFWEIFSKKDDAQLLRMTILNIIVCIGYPKEAYIPREIRTEISLKFWGLSTYCQSTEFE